MGRRLLYTTLSLVAGLLVAACASIDGEGIKQQVSLHAVLHTDAATRSLSAGTSVDYLVCAAYIDGQLVTSTTAPVADCAATVTLDLARSKQYDIVMWACKQSQDGGFTSPWSFDPATGTVTASYDAVTATSEDYDAFWYRGTLTVGSDMAASVELKRAVAQFMVGTASATGEVSDISLSLTAIPTAWNLLSGTLSDAANLEFQLGAAPDGETFMIDETQYNTLAMVCLLSGADTDYTDMTLTLTRSGGSVTKTVSQAAYRRNWCTRIAGNY